MELVHHGSSENMSFKTSIHDNISLKDLIKISKSGGLVLKTPHVGNIYPNNLAIALLGLPILFYDRTLGRKDVNFHPDKLILNGTSVQISNPDILTTHSLIEHIPEYTQKEIKIGERIVDFHMNAFKQALPHSHCFTYTEYLCRNREKILQLLEKATDLRPYLWTRIVDEKGRVHKKSAKNWNTILELGVLGLTNNKAGWIIPNPISVLFHGTIDILDSNQEDTFLLSGPDMYRYISGYEKDLNDIYEELKKNSNWNLPKNLNCHVIPVSGMRFIVEIDFKSNLDSLVESYIQYSRIDALIKENLNSENTQVLIGERSCLKQKIYDCIGQSIDAFARTMFYNIEEANCFTQHDLLRSKGLYIHPWAIENDLDEVLKAFNFLNNCYLFIKDNREI